MVKMSDDFNEFLKVITPSDEEKKIFEEQRKVHVEYMQSFQTESEARQRYFDFLKLPNKDTNKLEELKKSWEEAVKRREVLSKKSSELSKKSSSLLDESTKKLHDYSEKHQKEMVEFLAHNRDVISSVHKNLNNLNKQADLTVLKGKIQDLLSILAIIINKTNYDALKSKFNEQLFKISPLAVVQENDWCVSFVQKARELTTKENFDMIFALFKNTLIESEDIIRSTETKNTEAKVALLDVMLHLIDDWRNPYLEQRIQNIFKKYQIEKKHKIGVFELFFDLYENITAENYKSILGELLTS